MPDPQTGQYLVLRLAGREFAIHASRVHGMIQARGLDLRPTPGLGSRTMAAWVHGREIPVIAPHGPLRLRPQPVSARSCLVLIGPDASAPEFALLADSVSRIERIPAHLTRLEPENEFAVAQIRLGDKWRDVLDLDKIAAA